MRLGYELNIEQTQKLIMTPELRQAITILQLSSIELCTYIEQQLLENPLLELREEEILKEEEHDGDQEKQVEAEEKQSGDEIDWEEYFRDNSEMGTAYRERSPEQQPDYSYENFLFQNPTLSEHLMQQLVLSPCLCRDRMIGEYLIGNIDENGYLQVSLQEASNQLGVDITEIARILKIIQGFDPPGVGARNLMECLLVQVRQLGIKNELINKIIKNYLDDLAKGKLNRISQELGVNVKEVQEAADILKTLDPKPGRNFSSFNDIRYIVPDIILEKVEGEYVILVNDVSVPRVTINSTYRSVLSKEKNYDTRTRRFVESKLNAAAWLIKSIEQRRLTLYKVANCLVRLQREFLDHGVKYLKPLNLKTVAGIVGLHESTVSRATSNKYIQTPQGVFEMKYFFSNGLSNVTGTMTSAESIKKTLREIVAGEDATVPINDQKISEIFRRQGIKISRRTVAKYRSELGIPPIRKRKRY
jgi:RNA polymerase sigma-54 factor